MVTSIQENTVLDFALEKVVMDENGVILGADAIGAHAGEWIQFFTLAIKQELTLHALAGTIFIYPTFSKSSKRLPPGICAQKTGYEKAESVD